MNTRQIIALAAVMAAQTTVISLLHAGAAHAEKVYRCGSAYQQHACDAKSKVAVVDVRDARSGAQVAQAREQSESEGKAFRQFMRHRQQEIRERPAAKAIGLTAAKTGDGPFDHGPALSDAKRKGEPRLERRHRRKHVRLAKVPRPAEQAGAGTPVRPR
jgi:hypothetical protein